MWNIINAVICAAILVGFLLLTLHPKTKRKRLELIGFGISVISIPTLITTLLQDAANDAREAKATAATERRLTDNFADVKARLDAIVQEMVKSQTDPGKSPAQRRSALIASVAKYNTITLGTKADTLPMVIPPPLTQPLPSATRGLDSSRGEVGEDARTQVAVSAPKPTTLAEGVSTAAPTPPPLIFAPPYIPPIIPPVVPAVAPPVAAPVNTPPAYVFSSPPPGPPPT